MATSILLSIYTQRLIEMLPDKHLLLTILLHPLALVQNQMGLVAPVYLSLDKTIPYAIYLVLGHCDRSLV